MDRQVNPPKRVTSPTWGPPPPCKQALSFKFFLQLLCISLGPLIFPYSVQILLENALFCLQNARLKIAYSARNSAGRIYPSLMRSSNKIEL